MSKEPNDVGKILKAEREKRALSLDIVHETTKIPMDSLRAIEEGYKIRTLSTFYYKSFVKIYAKYLGMDADKILAMIPSTHPGTKIPVLDKLVPAAQRSVAPRQETRNLNLFARHTENRQGKKIVKIIVIGVVSLGLLALIIGVGQKIRQNMAANSAMDQAVKKGSSKKQKVKSDSFKKSEASKAGSSKSAAVVKKEDSETTSEQEQSGIKVSKKVSLTVRAKTTAWLKVKVDGATVFQGSLKKNNHVTWDAQKRIELSGKDIDQLEYEANGKAIGKIGRPNSRIKKVIVTPEGLSVDK